MKKCSLELQLDIHIHWFLTIGDPCKSFLSRKSWELAIFGFTLGYIIATVPDTHKFPLDARIRIASHARIRIASHRIACGEMRACASIRIACAKCAHMRAFASHAWKCAHTHRMRGNARICAHSHRMRRNARITTRKTRT